MIAPLPTPSATEGVGGEEVLALSAALALPPLVARVLWLRGHRDPAAAAAFLQPKLSQLSSPFDLPDMATASERVAQAVRAGEPIAVCGDYDVDGMTGTALLVRFLRLVGGKATYAVPDRLAEGYGLSVATVDRLADEGVSLLITVDNGVNAFDAIARAAVRGLDVVVTDHHLPGATLPPALAIVDPLRRDARPWVGAPLCGCALAFKLAWGVAEALGRARRDAALRTFLVDAVGLVALATVADVMPLVGENRALVAAGLSALAGSRHPGVRALLAVAGVGEGAITSDDIAWRLAPRLNAAGRMNTPSHAIDLFTTEDDATARGLADELERANEERRRIERGIVDEALLATGTVTQGRRSVVVAGEGWHRGVIGIVAARLVDAHRRPAVVIGLEGDGGRGSCRSAGGVHLVEALARCERHLRRYGGHAAAAGLEMDRAAVPAFAEAFEEAVAAQGRVDDGALEVDAEATPGEITLDVATALRRLEPFGAGNPEPRFLFRGAEVAGTPRVMGAHGDHLSFTLKTPTGAIRVVAFRQASARDLVASGAPLDLVATPTVNEWRGTRTPELRLHALNPPHTVPRPLRGDSR